MGVLTANSTNLVTFMPSADVDAVTLAVTVDGESQDWGQPVESDGLWALTVQSSSLPEPYVEVVLTWTLAAGTQRREVIERYDVAESAPKVPPPIALSDLREHLKIPEGADDAKLWELLCDASQVMQDYQPLTWPKVTETRRVFVDGAVAYCRELVTATAVTEALYGGAIAFLDGGPERLVLHSDITGDVLVTGTWGSDRPPPYRQRSVRITAGAWYRRFSIGDERDAIGSLASIPEEAMGLERANAVKTI